MPARILACFCVLALPLSTRAADAPRPNIVIILADDLGFSDFGCYGSEIATPNIDRLAANGTRFTQFYNTGRCCPTRASLLTGLYSHQVGIGHMVEDRGSPAYRGDLGRNGVTIAEALKPVGYRTAMSGKWHVASALDGKNKDSWPRQRGFDRFYGLLGSVRSYYDPPTLTDDNTLIRAGKDFYLTDAITDHAVASIAEMSKEKAPFFLYVAYTAPHWPMHAKPEDIAKYKDKYKHGWDTLRKERHERMIDMGLVKKEWGLTPRDTGVPAWDKETDKDWQAMRMAVYAAMIDRMDQGVGRIRKQLKDSNRDDNTLILVLADNGGCAEEMTAEWRNRFPEKTRDGTPTKVGNDPKVMPGPEHVFQSYGLGWANASNTPFRLYKHWSHEGGIATPLIAHWPATIKKPAITHQPGHLIDIMATCLEVAGAEYPKKHGDHAITPLEGKSLLPIIQGKTRPGHDALFWEHEGNKAVRMASWKLVSRHPDAWELYDLDADRTEMLNLASKQPDRVKEMAAKYAAWADRVGVRPWEKVNPEKK